MGDAEVKASQWRLVEVGRVVLFAQGPYEGKLATIVEIIDHKRVRSAPSRYPRRFERGILDSNTHISRRSSSMVPLPLPRRSFLVTPLLFPTFP